MRTNTSLVGSILWKRKEFIHILSGSWTSNCCAAYHIDIHTHTHRLPYKQGEEKKPLNHAIQERMEQQFPSIHPVAQLEKCVISSSPLSPLSTHSPSVFLFCFSTCCSTSSTVSTLPFYFLLFRFWKLRWHIHRTPGPGYVDAFFLLVPFQMRCARPESQTV